MELYASGPIPARERSSLRAGGERHDVGACTVVWGSPDLGSLAGLIALVIRPDSHEPRISAPATPSSALPRSCCCSVRQSPWSRRSASFSRSRSRPSASSEGFADRFSLRPAVVAADRDARRPGRIVRRLRHRSAGRRHAAHHLHCHARCRADRPVCGDLHGGICLAAGARLRQAHSRNPRRRADRRSRLLRGTLGCAVPARLGRADWPDRRFGIGARRRSRHGHDDHSLRVIALRRRHQCRAAVAARRFLCDGRHKVRDDQEGRAAGGACRASCRPSCWAFRAPSAKP